jgi:hypothetical protein
MACVLGCVLGSVPACGDSERAEPVLAHAAPRHSELDAAVESNASEPPESAPIVFIIADSSGSMERIPGCVCQDLSCIECVPDCDASESSGWIDLLAALTGSFEVAGCTAYPRTVEKGATFDTGYYLDYHRPPIEEGQLEDGMLDVYGARIRFGVGTFDGQNTYLGGDLLQPLEAFDTRKSAAVEGLWSFGTIVDGAPRVRPDGSVVGRIGYPNTTTYYFVDTGLRSQRAAQGRFIFPQPGDASMNAVVEQTLLATRTYGSSPIAAALDDLDHHLRDLQAERPAVPVHVLLITDGLPDDDYRGLGCDCGSDPELMEMCPPPESLSCPYPTAPEVARALRCGYGDGCEDGVVDAIHVVALGDAASDESDVVDAIAREGGTTSAHRAPAGELRGALSDVADAILEP